MTQNSTQFITPLTLQSLSKRPIHVDVMQERQPDRINHIELAKQADLSCSPQPVPTVLASWRMG